MKLLINSSKYLDLDLTSELGKLPSAFVPVGGQRLLCQIFNTISEIEFDEKWISIPSDYKLTEFDEAWLDRHSFIINRPKPGLALAEAVNETLVKMSDGPILMLHGDTLSQLPTLSKQCVFTAQTIHDYRWHKISGETSPTPQRKEIWAGAFYFESCTKLSQCIDNSAGNFETAVHDYFNDNIPYVQLESWLDFSHVNTYFESRKNFLQSRAFNSFSINGNVIKKVSSEGSKLQDEYNWYNSAPVQLQQYLPATYECGSDYYSLEYLPLIPLNEIFVLGRKDLSYWSLVIDRALDFVDESKICDKQTFIQKPSEELYSINQYLYIDKLKARYENIEWENLGVDHALRSAVEHIYQKLIQRNLSEYGALSYMHGDLCLSNIMFDLRNYQLKVIDPRGSSGSELKQIGNINYDIAKLAHSFIGNYDEIIHSTHERHALNTSSKTELQKLFISKLKSRNYDISKVMTDVLVLFLSMIPLHYDNSHRQKLFLMNVVRLNEKYSIC